MAIRYSRPARETRIVIRENHSLNILEYGEGNMYPQQIQDQVDKSGTASVCVEQFSNFMSGEGFDMVGDTIVNPEGQTLDDILSLASDDYAELGGFALHVSYSRLGQKTAYRHMDFAKTRLPLQPQTNDYIVYMPNIGDTWKSEDEFKTVNIPRFNPGKVNEQIQESKRPDVEFMGQILWYSRSGKFTYPLPTYGAVIEDLDTEHNITVSKNSAVKSGFSARHIMYYNDEFEDDQDFDDFVGGIQKYSGPEQQGAIIVLETKVKGMIELHKIEQSDNAEAMYKYVEESTSDSIRESFAIPPVLIGKYPKGSLGSSKEYIDSVSTYNMITRDERKVLQVQFSQIMGIDLIIKQLQFEEPNPVNNGIN